MEKTFETLQTPVVGADGYQYYSYGIGAAWKVETPSFCVLYRIIESRFEEDGEYQTFTVAVESPHDVQIREMTLDRLNYLLESGEAVEQVEAGAPVQLPLMKDEVERYYTKIVSDRVNKKKDANTKLRRRADYQALVGEEKLLIPAWIQAAYEGAENEMELEKRVAALCKKRKEIFAELEIKASDLNAEDECMACGGRGIMASGKICACARKQAHYIQAYCAAERRVRQAVKWK